MVALWNLEQRCLHHVVRDAHDAPLLGLHFFAGEPRLMSSGADNSIKQWVSAQLCDVWLCVGACVGLSRVVVVATTGLLSLCLRIVLLGNILLIGCTDA